MQLPPSLVLKSSSIFAPLPEQLNNLGDGRGKESQAHSEEEHLKGKSENSTWKVKKYNVKVMNITL